MALLVVYPYKNGSKSVAEIKKATGGIEIKRENSRFVGKRGKTIINWGSSQVSEEAQKCRIINNPVNVAKAGNKLTAFEVFREVGVEIPPFTHLVAEAARWIAEGKQVVCRTKLNGHSGEGIVLAETVEQLVVAPLYTQYVPKKQEYRVHVFGGDVIDIQRKARKLDVADANVNWKIRNLDGGFIYARDFAEADLPRDVRRLATRAVAALGLDFGAVDIIHNQNQGQSYVLEVNTAPGLQGQTLEAYVNKFKELGLVDA